MIQKYAMSAISLKKLGAQYAVHVFWGEWFWQCFSKNEPLVRGFSR